MFNPETFNAARTDASDFIIVSDQRWETARNEDFPWRLIGKRRVLFVERPICSPCEDKPRLQVFSHLKDHVTIVCLVYPGSMAEEVGENPGYDNEILQPIYNDFLKRYLQSSGYSQPVLWLRSAAGATFASEIDYRLLVYDLPKGQSVDGGVSVQVINASSIVLRPEAPSASR
jgi:hypothetical protein